MKKYKVILTESEMRKLNEVRRNDDEFITVDHIDKSNYKKYIGKKVNVKGDVDLSNLHLKELPIIFGYVIGNFDCSNNDLINLKNSPKELGCDFDCSNNKLRSLDGFTIYYVDEDFDCSGNKLTSLKGCPKRVDKTFCCSYNNLISLTDCPAQVGDGFYCSNNKKKFTEEYVESKCIVYGEIIV